VFVFEAGGREGDLVELYLLLALLLLLLLLVLRVLVLVYHDALLALCVAGQRAQLRLEGFCRESHRSSQLFGTVLDPDRNHCSLDQLALRSLAKHQLNLYY